MFNVFHSNKRLEYNYKIYENVVSKCIFLYSNQDLDIDYFDNKKMKQFIKEFKTFAMRGNVLDMAVGVVVGGAFSKIVTSLVNDIITPLIGMFLGKVNFSEIVVGSHLVNGGIKIGLFIQSVIDFMIIAFSIFCAIKVINHLFKKQEVKEEKTIKISQEVELLQEIRDLLKQKQ